MKIKIDSARALERRCDNSQCPCFRPDVNTKLAIFEIKSFFYFLMFSPICFWPPQPYLASEISFFGGDVPCPVSCLQRVEDPDNSLSVLA